MKKALTILAATAFLTGCQPQDTTIDEPAGAPRQDMPQQDQGATNDPNGGLQPGAGQDQPNPPAVDQNQTGTQTP